MHYKFEYPKAKPSRLCVITRKRRSLPARGGYGRTAAKALLFPGKVRQRTDPQRCSIYLQGLVAFEGTTMRQAEVFTSVTQQRDWRSLGPSIGQSEAERDEEEQQRNLRFVNLLNGFRESGGLARSNEVASLFQRRSEQHISVLGGWLIKRQAIAFEWHSKLWMPLFQFNPSDMTLRTGLAGILAELVVVCNDWEVANWFARPNPWLSDGLPADALAVAAPQVLWAARAERSAALANSQ